MTWLEIISSAILFLIIGLIVSDYIGQCERRPGLVGTLTEVWVIVARQHVTAGHGDYRQTLTIAQEGELPLPCFPTEADAWAYIGMTLPIGPYLPVRVPFLWGSQ